MRNNLPKGGAQNGEGTALLENVRVNPQANLSVAKKVCDRLVTPGFCFWRTQKFVKSGTLLKI